MNDSYQAKFIVNQFNNACYQEVWLKKSFYSSFEDGFEITSAPYLPYPVTLKKKIISIVPSAITRFSFQQVKL